MKKCNLHIVFDKRDRTYARGEKITGTIEARTDAGVTCQALTLTPEWRASGKGNPAKGKFATITLFQGRWLPGETVRHVFSIDMPSGPVTYHGRILNVDWYLKARAYIPWAIPAKAEENFIVVPDRETTEKGAQWKSSPDQWPEEIRPDQTSMGAVLTIAVFALSFIFSGLPILILMAFSIAQSCIRYILVRRRLGRVDVITVPRTVHGGETAELRVSFESRAVADLRKVTAKFVGRERVISGDSESNQTNTQLIYEETAVIDTGRRLIPGQRVFLQHELRVPAAAPPTFEQEDNHLEWIVMIHFDMPWPDLTVECPITVLP